ncbi:asparagine synthase (glutamine-hydrolyzing) [Desulfuribacillus alkaliarsenatis]|uniref:asparagine synthase (glutamine-hydrolyzing) n=1 Tax=Desulfuribacillus alkaliarsenatis TaxID=766136 RepID=A0A1E5G6D7_9FIRM|nr:asparagine synthase (glutamine-hydrolyzing) [Desulfuribacillus alkaliarsenatis]
MCGISGIYNKNRTQLKEVDSTYEIEAKKLLESMTQQILHRGPDDFGFHINGPAGLGFRRLSIIDLEGGHQPLTNEDGTVWIAFNGEIYNYKELREELITKGHRFSTDSDTEVIIHLYEELGPKCAERLRGMFAFLIWDEKNQRLYGARDPFGIKPYYYVETNERFAFASEIKSLLQLPEYKAEVDEQSFLNYLTFQYVPDPMTMFKGIMKLPAAHYFTIENNEMNIERYWKVDFKPDESKDLNYFVEGIRDVMRDSVKAHLVSDVPRGAFLSSGIDSSAIVALVKEIEDVRTFTVGFDCGKYNEADYARETANYIGTKHEDLTITSEMFWTNLPRLVWHQDDPVADPSAIALYFVAKIASEHITVVLSGEGADEIFGGYNIYHEPESLKMFQYIPPGLRKTLADVASVLPEGMKGKGFIQRGSKSVEERFFGNAFIFNEDEKKQLSTLEERFFQFYRKPNDVTREVYNKAVGYDDITKMQYLDLHTWLPGDILMKADKMTMANSLELRVPFLDKKVFEFAATIPTKYRVHNGTTKYALREAMKQVLPEQVANRKKLGFPVPTRDWLRGGLYRPIYELIVDSQTEHLISKNEVLNLLEIHKSGKADVSRKLWTIIIFMLWHRIFIEKRETFEPMGRKRDYAALAQ